MRRMVGHPFCAPFNDIDMGEDSQPIDFLNLLFMNSMWETIVVTNLYTDRWLRSDELTPNSRIIKRRPTSIE